MVDVNRRNAVQKLKKKFDWGIKEEYKQEVRKKCEWPETSEFNDNSTMDQPTNIIPELCVEYWFEKMMYIDIITQQTFSNLGQQKGSSQFKKEM